MIPPVVILAGGLATRLRPITETIPKSLVPVGGKPFIFHQLEFLKRNGVREIVLCVGVMGEMIQRAVEGGETFGLRIRYMWDGPEPLGTGGALKQALPHLHKTFIVLYGDSYLDISMRAVYEEFMRSDKFGLMAVFRNDGRWDTSNVHFESGEILQYDKKHPSPLMHHIDYGLGIFQAEAFDRYPGGRAFDMEIVYQDLLHDHQLAVFEATNRFYEIGSPGGLAELEQHLHKNQNV